LPFLQKTKRLICRIRIDAIGRDFARRIVLLDSGSTDLSIEIARSREVEVLEFFWNGKFPEKRNWFLKEHTPLSKWVLFLDADEYLTSQFKEELKKLLPHTQHAGFWLSYSVYFQGRRLKGGYPLDKLALFRVGSGEYERIDEDSWSDLDMEVHEHPLINGSVGFIRSKIAIQTFEVFLNGSRSIINILHGKPRDLSAMRVILLSETNRRFAAENQIFPHAHPIFGYSLFFWKFFSNGRLA
jgi:glycosyltransferase involved in cell wall biosynthesis